MYSLKCKKCNYKFAKEKIPARCPYCATANTVQVEKTSQELIDEVSEEIDEIESNKKDRGY